MKETISRFIKTCPKTGKFKGFIKLNGLTRLLFALIGLAAFVWILFIAASETGRLNYPCIKTAIPFVSGFIGYSLKREIVR
jgi:hypothetical protein